MQPEIRAWVTVGHLLALLVLIAALVLTLVGQLDAKAGLMWGALAIAVLLD